MSVPFLRLDHVQLAMPKGHEDDARQFYCALLGMEEVPKPPNLAARGGVWFRSGDVQIHLGIDEDFRPAKKAHPALTCTNYRRLLVKLRAAGVPVREDHDMPGVERCHIQDVFGNRIELISN